ncbi:MAG TPA: zf-HC2 domain-containing protein [Acidimicrobiales bacterium]
MSCREAVRRLWGYLDGDLRPGEAEDVDAHLQHCVTCCGELEFARELRRLLAARRTTTLPVEVRGRLDRYIDRLGDVDGEGVTR